MMMSMPISPCFMCRHYTQDLKCRAFPRGIPKAILNGLFEHTRPYPKQGNDIVFTPKLAPRKKRRQQG